MAVDLPERWIRRIKGSSALAAAVVVLLCNCPPAQAAPKPRSEEWWFEAWQVTHKVWPLTQGKGVTIGLIDSGVEAQLPELRGVVLPGKGIDGSSNHDGRVDTDTRLGGHGTGMAALIAAQGTGSGMTGVAPASRILPVVSESGPYEITIRYAVDHGANVINVSEGIPAAECPSGVQAAVNYAVEHDVIIVAAAGNDPLIHSTGAPANCAGVLAVGAVDAHLTPWQKSTSAANVMLAAPGVYVGSVGRAGIFTPGGDGTSSAAALTSGVAALMRSHFPKMSGREIVQRMLATARDIGPKGWDKKTGYGALVPYKALTTNVPKDAPNPVYSTFMHVHQGEQVRPSSEDTLMTEGNHRPVTSADHNPTLLTIFGAALGLVVFATLGASIIHIIRTKRSN